MEGKWGVQVHQTQEMKGKESAGDPGGPDAKSGRYSSGSGLCPSGEKGFFADGVRLIDIRITWVWEERFGAPFISDPGDYYIY